MKRRDVLIATLLLSAPTAYAKPLPPPVLVHTIALPHVKGRIDHLAVDVSGHRLFIAAVGNDTVEIVDLLAGSQVRTLTGFHEPQDVLFLPEYNALVVTNGADGTCQILDGTSFVVRHTVRLAGDADNLRYDSQQKQFYVGYGDGGLAVIDPGTGNQLAAIPLAAHPEAFEIESSGARIFINVPGAHQISVVDRHQHTILATWALQGVSANFPMALDERHHRLFVGTRAPARLLVLDTESGRTVTTLESVGDADGIFYDASRQRIYVSGGEGLLQTVQQLSADTYQPRAALPTAVGARSSLFVPQLHRLFLAVPHHGHQEAEIRIYDTGALGTSDDTSEIARRSAGSEP